MHIQSIGPLMRELRNARELAQVVRAIGQHGPTLIDADTVAFVAAGDDGVADDSAIATHITTVPVKGHHAAGAIVVRWRSHHVVTRDEIAVLQAIADATALAVDTQRFADAVQKEQLHATQSQRDSETLLATVGHELRQPLGAIVNCMTTLQQRVSVEVGERARAIMARQVDQLRRITDDLFDTVQMQRGTFVLDAAPLDVVGAVSECVDAVRNRVDDRHQRLTVSSSEPALWASGDSGRIRQIASNLLDNAVKYTPLGGTIDVSLTAESEWVVLRIRDSGRGITPEHLPLIFDPFFQARSGSSGLGIGLSVVKRLTEAQGGRFEARSDGQGLGSTFTVRFPVCTAPAESIAV